MLVRRCHMIAESVMCRLYHLHYAFEVVALCVCLVQDCLGSVGARVGNGAEAAIDLIQKCRD